MSDKIENRPLLVPMAGSIVAAALLLVFWVLPAEYDIDPTGFGQLTGLTGLAGQDSQALELNDAGPVTITRSFELLGFESLEFKLEMAERAGMVFSWTASDPVHFDMHAEPDGAEEGFAVTFADGDATRQAGTYTAEFAGVHGWYWANESAEPVTIELTVHGFASETLFFRDGQVQRETIGRE